MIADLGDAYCLELRRTRVGPFDVAGADPSRIVPLGDALAAVMPVVELTGDDARRAVYGVSIETSAPVTTGPVLLRDEDGPIAVAERREGDALKPVVGFRSA